MGEYDHKPEHKHKRIYFGNPHLKPKFQMFAAYLLNMLHQKFWETEKLQKKIWVHVILQALSSRQMSTMDHGINLIGFVGFLNAHTASIEIRSTHQSCSIWTDWTLKSNNWSDRRCVDEARKADNAKDNIDANAKNTSHTYIWTEPGLRCHDVRFSVFTGNVLIMKSWPRHKILIYEFIHNIGNI